MVDNSDRYFKISYSEMVEYWELWNEKEYNRGCTLQEFIDSLEEIK